MDLIFDEECEGWLKLEVSPPRDLESTSRWLLGARHSSPAGHHPPREIIGYSSSFDKPNKYESEMMHSKLSHCDGNAYVLKLKENRRNPLLLQRAEDWRRFWLWVLARRQNSGGILNAHLSSFVDARFVCVFWEVEKNTILHKTGGHKTKFFCVCGQWRGHRMPPGSERAKDMMWNLSLKLPNLHHRLPSSSKITLFAPRDVTWRTSRPNASESRQWSGT